MNKILFKILICFLAGMGAGLGTGFAGLSAATVISPMLLTFLGVPSYDAIGIALASDVLASAVSARTYAKNKCLDIKNGLVMMAGVLAMTVVGSWLSSFLESRTLGSFSVIMTLFLGVKFLIFPVVSTRKAISGESRAVRFFKSLVCGMAIGLVCGFFGAGGGMMMLFVLTMVLGYELKTAVGTSVFIMTFSAFTGAFSHFLISQPSQLDLLAMCIVFTLLWAQIGAKIAAKAETLTLNRIIGVILTVLGVSMLLVTYL